jgi:acetyl esterase/lipase
MFGPVEHVYAVEERDIAGPGGELRVRIYRPDGRVRLPVLVYFHGGG